MRRFVQFPHPGKEAGPDRQTWLGGDTEHRRYFVVSSATFRRSVDASDERSLVAAWVEWEAATECVERPKGGHPGFPEWLHRPIPPAISPPRSGVPQNTDPLVFGDRFLTTFCRQRQSRQLHALGRGSVLIFGSRLRGEFVLDTVLVVKGAVRHDRGSWLERLDGQIDDLAAELTLKPMYAWPGDHSHTALLGATPDDPVDGMFSFVPCMPERKGELRGFARPSMNGLRGINERNWRALGFNSEISETEIPILWSEVADRVVRNGLALGTRLAPPPRDAPWTRMPAASRSAAAAAAAAAARSVAAPVENIPNRRC